MKLLISTEELSQKTYREPIPIECEICKTTFHKFKNLVMRGLKGTRAVCVCSEECRKKKLSQLKFHGYVTLTCENCKKEFQRTKRIYDKVNVKGNKKTLCSRKCTAQWEHSNGLWKNHPNVIAKQAKYMELVCNECSKKFQRLVRRHRQTQIKRGCLPFCSKSCASKWLSRFRIPVYRSKLEIWLEGKLKEKYPNLIIKYNDRNSIDGELDIYIPSLELAFELNGLYHYEPIFGQKPFEWRQKKDKEKIEECKIKRIEMFTVDCRTFSHLKEKEDNQYLNFICEKIKESERVASDAHCTSQLVAERSSP